MVECNDGTVSLAGGLAGACSGHGGVKLAVYDSGTVSSITTPASSNQVVTASSGELAFTGPGSGLKTATIVGAVLMLVGIVMLLLSDPRRLISQLAYLRLGRRSERRNGGEYVNAAMSGQEDVAGSRQRAQLFVHEAEQAATPSRALPPDAFGGHGEHFDAKGGLSARASNEEVAAGSARTQEVTPGLRVLRIIPGHPAPVPGVPAGFSGDFFAAAEPPSSATMDTNGRSGWWLASDGEWYPPEQSPSYPDAVADAEERQASPHIEQEAGAGSPAAAWYTDPLTSGLRYWDGSRWTEHVAYRRDTTRRTGLPFGDDGESTGSIHEIQGRHARPRRDHAGGPEIPGWWLTPGSE